MIFCKKCGKILEEDQEKCPFCGDHDQEETIKDIPKQNLPHSFDKALEEIEQPTGSFSKPTYTPVPTPPIGMIPPLSNWIKVLLAVTVPILPGIGPLIGIIAGAIFMSNQDEDRKTFGQALLTVSIIVFIILCGCCMLFSVAAQQTGSELDRLLNNLSKL